jgi:hypothetical protein
MALFAPAYAKDFGDANGLAKNFGGKSGVF